MFLATGGGLCQEPTRMNAACLMQAACTIAALAIEKAGPRPYHFRSGPTSGPTLGQEAKKVKSPSIVLLS